jgi:death-on-curing family protein
VNSAIRHLDTQRIIDINKKIIESWNSRHFDNPEHFQYNKDRIDEVLEIVRNVADDLDHKRTLVEKAAFLVGGLAWNQPFSGANKRTAILCCTIFLSENGYQLNIPENQNPELRQMLFDIQEHRNEINKEIISKLVLYIAKFLNKT